ncbi:MAG: hypothetical protein JO101_00135, partial [Candidatus Eremiobacteraeota bacterium]|nr:hypothetical protein [Candidatus Eremiobacteraeota bacterium]
MPHVAVTSAALLIALTSTAALAVTPPAVTGGGAAPAAAPASPASAAAVKEPPLKEIGRVTSSAACTNIVIRANSVIGASLRNDQTVALAVTTLRRVDLDTTNPIDRNKAVHEIDRIATELRNSAGNADAQIKKLRELSDESTDPVRKADLKEFADAL